MILLLIIIGSSSRPATTDGTTSTAGLVASSAAAPEPVTATLEPAAPVSLQPPVVAAAPDVPVALAPAHAITAREWALIAKDPAAHTGERVIVYGKVTQFDAATGDNGFRANIDGVEHKPDEFGFVDYMTNTVLQSDDAGLVANLVEGDLFRADVTVAGPDTYETTMGGSLTAPLLTVTRVKNIGHV